MSVVPRAVAVSAQRSRSHSLGARSTAPGCSSCGCPALFCSRVLLPRFQLLLGVSNVGDHHYNAGPPRYVEGSGLSVDKWRLHKNACGLFKNPTKRSRGLQAKKQPKANKHFG